MSSSSVRLPLLLLLLALGSEALPHQDAVVNSDLQDIAKSQNQIQTNDDDDDDDTKVHEFHGNLTEVEEDEDRIIDGFEARDGQFPHMVSFGGCGGTLLTSQWVLTAAHCVEPAVGSAFGMCVGTNDRLTRSRCTGQFRFARRSDIVLHPRYNTRTGGAVTGFDIALVRMNAPVQTGGSIVPARVYTGGPLTGFRLYTTGWGLTCNTGRCGQSDRLKGAITQVLGDGRFCGLGIDNQPPLSTIICTGEGRGTNGRHCSGDSGGYLGGQTRSGEHVVVGVTSFAGLTCERLHGFTDVSSFSQWIFDTVG